ncbi:glycerate kinase [Scrofimicrobium sp. R131]|uniref:Glycerate kinase n=1 Tax=Scrofimicrobium appendicitidis TaxID=3079930 RepID=A0AAU7VAD3_9ACTO
MRIVVAPDSFKGTLTAVEVAAAMADGIGSVWPNAEVIQLPLADGGEGTLAALAATGTYQLVKTTVPNQAGSPVEARWAWDPIWRVAVVESAQAVGLELVPAGRRDVYFLNSAGVGELIRAARQRGARRIVLTVGGTGTIDAGIGMMHALGLRFRAADGSELDPIPNQMTNLATVDSSELDPDLAEVEFVLATDVDNPLVGADGAAAEYGPQKGLPAAKIPALDQILARIARCCTVDGTGGLELAPGAGAGGGLGWAALNLLRARRVSGATLVAELSGLANAISGADLVLTGEGRVDQQTLRGKTALQVVEQASAAGVPSFVIGGQVLAGANQLLARGAAAVIPLGYLSHARGAELDRTAERIRRTTRDLCRTLEVGRRL